MLPFLRRQSARGSGLVLLWITNRIVYNWYPVLPDMGISEEVFGDSDLAGIGLGKSEILGTNMGDF